MTGTLFVGLDGATFTVLDQLTRPDANGHVAMPFLARMIAGGSRAKLQSTPNPLTPPAWVSLMTGRSPGNHGVFDFMRADERDGEIFFTLSDSRDVRTETIWSIASRENRSVVALNFPITAPPRPVNGSMVPGFVPWRHLRKNVTPPELFDRLKQIPGFNAKELAWDFEQEAKALDTFTEEEVERWVEYHLPREDQWHRIATVLMQEDSPDLMAVMFDGTDKIQHHAWTFLAAEGDQPGWSDTARRIRALCLRYFANVDRYIQELFESLGPGGRLFIASDHGFTQSVELVRINVFLGERGYLRWREDDGSEAAKKMAKGWFADLDWDNTLAYCRTPSSNGITIRVAEQPGGAGIDPAEYEAFRERLIADLRDFRDPATGEPVIQAIHTREAIFPGEANAQAPDLTLVLRDFGFVSNRNDGPALERRTVPVGTHHPDGVFIACGDGVSPGAELERFNIVNVAAILLYSIGLPVPSDFEGRVPDGLFTPAHLAGNPVKKGRATTAVQARSEQGAIDEDEKKKIMDQLQMLGYMD